MNPLLKKIKERDALPPLPEIVQRINKKMKDPECAAQDVAMLTLSDPVLVGRIIKANVSKEKSNWSFTDLKQSIASLECDEIKEMVYSKAVLNLFDNVSKFDPHNFWRHSLSVAFYSQSLANIKGLDAEDQSLAYVAGLFHDIGIMLFIYLVPGIYETLLSKIADDQTPKKERKLSIQEENAFGISHPKLGAAYIKEWWTKNTTILEAVQNHHQTSSIVSKLSTTTRIVHIANRYSNSQSIMNGIMVFKEPFKDETFEMLSLTKKQKSTFKEMASAHLTSVN
ncbi:MAG: HDOD domain-containing protein [Candidatus Electryonea clarkiae]|nr:HDOD domain-containing protein [Candidatus Electryonea clarkiae]MDP8288301.1 HDOD domain-containing protein [Candidatus Electryonea clarkiae]